MKMSKHVAVWIMERDTVVIYTFVTLVVHLFAIIKIITDGGYVYLKKMYLYVPHLNIKEYFLFV
jgi:nitrate reductase NapE component